MLTLRRPSLQNVSDFAQKRCIHGHRKTQALSVLIQKKWIFLKLSTLCKTDRLLARFTAGRSDHLMTGWLLVALADDWHLRFE